MHHHSVLHLRDHLMLTFSDYFMVVVAIVLAFFVRAFVGGICFHVGVKHRVTVARFLVRNIVI